jgi:pimeloyl-ACP methyl ester carboxylesterase
LLALVCESLTDVPACHVLASSFGGPLGIMLAAAEPEKVRGLILCATFVRPPRPLFAPFRWVLCAPLLWSLRTLRRLPVWMRSRDDELRRAKRETWQRVSARGLAARARAALKVDVRAVLAGCRQPLLNVDFDRDAVVPRHNAEEILAQRRDADRVTLAGGHLAMFHDPAALAAEVLRFVESGAAQARLS